MHYSTGEIIAVENCTMQKIASEAQTYHQYNPHLGVGALYKIVARLLHLTPGNYLLHHIPKDGPFVALLREVDERFAQFWLYYVIFALFTFSFANTLFILFTLFLIFFQPLHCINESS